jgi:ketosteroid isomerase-like protein
MLQEFQFGSVTTDNGVLSWDGDEDLKAGDAVYKVDADGNRTDAPDGDYKTDDNKVIVVVDGKVAEIKDAEAEIESEFINTDKGKLVWDNEEEDLKAGDAVYLEDEDGNRTPAPDGDYTTEDGKIIKVADGKVTEIVDDKAEVASQDLKAKLMSRFAKVKEAFEESFDTKMREISNAIASVINTENFYLVDAGDDFGVVETWDEETYESHYLRYAITWNEDGTANAADPQEVKLMFVPIDFESPFAKADQEEVENLRNENASLKAEVAKLKKTPAAKPAHQEVTTSMEFGKTGHKGLDNLAKLLSAK